MEELLQLYGIPLAYVDGQKVAKLARDELAEPTKASLLDCIANRDEVVPIIAATGQRFKADAGETLAASLIQSVWRMHGLRNSFNAMKKERHAAAAIQEVWRSTMVRTAFLAGLWRKRTREREEMRDLQEDLVTSWPAIKGKHRVVVHVPSVTYDLAKRKTMCEEELVVAVAVTMVLLLLRRRRRLQLRLRLRLREDLWCGCFCSCCCGCHCPLLC